MAFLRSSVGLLLAGLLCLAAVPIASAETDCSWGATVGPVSVYFLCEDATECGFSLSPNHPGPYCRWDSAHL